MAGSDYPCPHCGAVMRHGANPATAATCCPKCGARSSASADPNHNLAKEPAQSRPGASLLPRIRNWLRRDMLVMRWVFLGLYAAIVGCLWLGAWFGDFDQLFLLILAAVTLGCQALFLFGGGTIHLCRPIRKRRLWMPALVAALLFGLLAGGLFMALWELFCLDDSLKDRLGGVPFGVLFWGTLIANWILWFLVFFLATQRWRRMRTLGRITAALVTGSLAELLVAIPAHIIVSRRPGCFVGLLTMFGIVAGLYVMLFAFGPGIVLLFLRPRYRRERIEGPPKGELRWNQFRLRTLLLAMLVVAIAFSWIGARMQQARKNRRMAAEIHDVQAEIERLGGVVSIFCEDVPDSLDDLFKDPGVFRIEGVEIQGRLDDTLLELLGGLPNPPWLTLADTQITSEEIKELQEALPNCEIRRLEMDEPR